MKRYRVLQFFINSTRSGVRTGTVLDKMPEFQKQQTEFLSSLYGTMNKEDKIKRYMELDKPVLAVTGEFTMLLEDVCGAYALGSLYAALTGACCLGERVFNDIIFRVKEDFKSSPWYKEIYNKDSIIDWEKAINILTDWNILTPKLKEQYLHLYKLRTTSVHYQKRKQMLEPLALNAINTINYLIDGLFGADINKRDILIWCEVPGEIFIRKEAEQLPLMKAYYIPCSRYVGYKYKIKTDLGTGQSAIVDDYSYEDKEVSDDEFVKLRKDFIG